MKVQVNLHGSCELVLHETLRQISSGRNLKQHCPRAGVAGQEEGEVRYQEYQLLEEWGTRNERGGKLSS